MVGKIAGEVVDPSDAVGRRRPGDQYDDGQHEDDEHRGHDDDEAVDLLEGTIAHSTSPSKPSSVTVSRRASVMRLRSSRCDRAETRM